VRPGIATLNDYQVQTARTGAAHDGHPAQRLILALGLNGEAGEVAELLKKEIAHGVPYDRDRMIEELGDAFWYLSELARAEGFTLEEVALRNVQKLRRRYPDGFDPSRGKE
jgi:NTP pyrophosphatase (non-canonical NTP hydrolase)